MILRHSALLGVLLASSSTVFATDTDISTLERASNNSLLWGPYRPNLYFGVRPRIPESLSLGLLWAKVEEYNMRALTANPTDITHTDTHFGIGCAKNTEKPRRPGPECEL